VMFAVLMVCVTTDPALTFNGRNAVVVLSLRLVCVIATKTSSLASWPTLVTFMVSVTGEVHFTELLSKLRFWMMTSWSCFETLMEKEKLLKR